MTKSKDQGLRRQRVAAVRARLESRFYHDPDIENDLLAWVLNRLREELETCQVGDGNLYRDLAADALAWSLKSIVDVPMMRKEAPIAGGRADIEMPLRIESLGAYPLWEAWHSRYDVRCILVETKNLKNRATHQDVNQLMGYLERGKRGRLGLIVSRNGFTANASKTLSAIAEDDRFLMLPFDNTELQALLAKREQSPADVMEFLRQKATSLLQTA